AAPITVAAVSERSTQWPDVPFAYLIAAACILAVIFAVGLSWVARSREEKELAKAQRDASRWIYRMAS
ncbi:MAG: hypothetical protein LDL14_00220, partial [Nitrospira sp.]|nr:hypothetical protein [Nitrospira sp.]